MARNKKASQYQELSLFDSNGEALFSARPAGAAEADAFKPVLDKWERLLSEAGGKVRLSYPTVDREKRMAGLLYDTKPTRLFITEGLPEGKDGSTRTEYGLRIDGTPGTDKYKEAENLLDVYNSVSSLHNKGYEHEGRQESAFYFYSVEAAMAFSLFADFSRNKGKEAERKNTKDSKKTIHDVGPKVYGARKDLYAEMVERVQRNAALPSEDLDEKIKNTPKAKLFDFDLDRLVKMGYPNSAVSYIKIMKDYARPKPKTSYSWKLQEWFFDTRFLYKQCLKAFLHPESIPGFFDSAGEYDPDIKDVHYGYNAYMAVGGYKSGRSIGDAILYRLSDGTVGWSADGKRREDNGGKWRLSRAGSHGDVYDTFDEAAAQLLEYTVELQKKEEMKKEARKKPKDAVICCWHNSQSTAGYWLAPKKFSDIILAEGFKTKKEAFAYGREHYAELQDKYRRIRAAGEVYYHENRPRTGKDWRKGKDVSPEEFKKMFGFKALVFGNYVTQKEGQVLLNDSYDAFMDFTDALGLPPEAVSLGGKMEFGIGSHGKGGRSGAAAKFIYNDDKKEPIIAITKNDGPGTLGHELFHAIDCYSAYRWEKRGYATNGDGRHPGTQRDFHLNADGTCRYKGKDYGKDDTDRLLTGYPSERNITYAWQQLAEALTKPGSDYYRRAKVYDELHPRMKDGKNTHYYIQPTELGARAFSTWMENRLKEKGCRNDFLCNNPEIEEDKLSEEQRKYIYYPFGEDNERLKEPFDNLIRTMKAKYEKERPMLYQMGSQPKMNDYGAEARKLATEFVMERLKNAGVDVRIATDEEAKAAAKGKADDIYGWQEGNRVYLTKDGINPETPIHEYTHLWARAMMVKNPEGWKNVKDLLRDTPVWNEVVSDRNYTNIIPNDDYIASEALARATGRDRGQQLNYEARNQLLFGKTGGREETAKGLLARMDNAIHRFWTWVGKELFGIKKFDSIDDVTARVMHDLMKGTDVRLNEGDFMLYQPIAKQEVYHNNISPKGIIKMAEGQERKRQGFSEALDDGSRLDLAGLTLNPLSKDLAHTPYGDKVVYEDDRHLITSAQIYADGNDRHGIEQADTTTNVFRKIPGGEFFRRFDREYGGQPDREGRLRLLSMSDDVKKVLSARRGSFQKAFSMEAEKRGKDGFLETGEVRIKVGDRDITVNDELLGAYTEGNVNEQEAMAVITAAKADPNIRKILELSFEIDKDMENNKQRTADIGETAEAAGGRWHQQEQNESRVWGIYGQHIADYIKSYSGWLRLEKQHYSYSGHSVRDLMRTLVTENRNFSTPNFYDSEYLRKNGLKVKDGEKPLPVLYESGGKMEIREEYNFDQIEGGTGGTDLAKEAGEQHFLPAEGIEDIVRESRWPVPIKTEYTPDGPTALMTAWFDKDNNNILVRPKEKEDIPDPARKALILEMMGYSLFETGRVKEKYKNENHFDGYSTMQRLMGFISFGIDFGPNQKDEQEYESKFLFMGDMEKMKAWSQKNADRFANDPDYTRDVLTKAAIVSKFIEDRARGIAYSQDEQIDDDVDASMEGRKKEDLLSENGDGLDPDGDGVTNIIQDLVGDSNGEEESEKRQDETRQHRHEESHLRR